VIKREAPANGTALVRYDIAYPVQVRGQLRGVVVLDAAPRPEEELRDAMRQLQWGSAWMEVLVLRGLAGTESAPGRSE
jgi:hypothetical protein